MDPESGSAPQVSYAPSQDGSQSLGVMQQMIQALLTRLKTLIDAFGPKDQSVGVENRFYFDEAEKVWKLRGGETEEERAEAEAFRFHTGRGLSNNLAPATTACDATRGDWQNGGLPPPPPAAGPVSSSMHGGMELPSHAMPSLALAHPVYAPQGLGQADTHVPPVPATSNPRQEAGSAQPLANPFGQISKQPPFGVRQPAVQRPVLASPFAPAL